jgi:carbon starvation protein
MIVTSDEIRGLKPGTIYGNGIGRFMTILIGRDNLPFAITFGAMAFSTFVFDTLDVCTRLGRYILQELFGWRTRAGALMATGLTIALPVYFIAVSPEGSWVKFWTLFGASNQLLAALTLLSITVWLYKSRRRIWFTLFPMIFVLVITLWSLAGLTISNLRTASGLDVQMLNAISAAALILLALFLAVTALFKVRGERKATLAAEAA